MSDQLFSTSQISQLQTLMKGLLDQQGQDFRREMLDMFDHFEKKFDKKMDQKIDALEIRLGTMIHEVVGHVSPKMDDHEVRLRAVERTIKFT